MRHVPKITVAPNGARLQRSDHAALPLSAEDLAEAALSCFNAGAGCIHLHVRTQQGVHSLDTDLYRAAIDAVSKAAPHIEIQITTESAGLYDVPAQLHLLRALNPAAASVSVREIARSPELAGQVYAAAQFGGTKLQHILYGSSCFDQLEAWLASGIVPKTMRDAIVVLGQYSPPREGRPEELSALLARAQKAGLSLAVCAFGSSEQACLIEAARLGCDLRVGFENNRTAPDGSIWAHNAEAVASLRSAIQKEVAA